MITDEYRGLPISACLLGRTNTKFLPTFSISVVVRDPQPYFDICHYCDGFIAKARGKRSFLLLAWSSSRRQHVLAKIQRRLAHPHDLAELLHSVPSQGLVMDSLLIQYLVKDSYFGKQHFSRHSPSAITRITVHEQNQTSSHIQMHHIISRQIRLYAPLCNIPQANSQEASSDTHPSNQPIFQRPMVIFAIPVSVSISSLISPSHMLLKCTCSQIQARPPSKHGRCSTC